MEQWQLIQRQHLELQLKVRLTCVRLMQWVGEFGLENVYIAFSGGKDSTVLLDIARNIYPEIRAVFVDTGLEYPEIRSFVKTIDHVEWIKPEKTFKKVLEENGYPILSKTNALKIRQAQTLPKDSKSYVLRTQGLTSWGAVSKIGKIPDKWMYLKDAPFKISEQCCDIMKKRPFKAWEKLNNIANPIIGTMASESHNRQKAYKANGCNAFKSQKPKSTPMGFWTEQDVLEYLSTKNVPYASIYGEILKDEAGVYYTTGEKRTGCMFCMFGCHLESQPNRFQRMRETHPKQYQYCIEKLGLGEILDYIHVPY